MRPALAYGLCFIGVCGHASSEFVAKIADTPGPEFSVWRFMIGGFCLIILSQFWPGQRDLITPLRENGLRIVILSWFGMALGQLVFHWSLDFTNVVQVATIVTAIPIFVVLIDWLINGTPVTAPKIVSGIGAFIGVTLLMTDGVSQELGLKGADAIGTLLALACALIGGAYLVLARPLIQQYGAVRMTTFTFALGFFFLFLVVGLFWGVWVNPLSLADKEPIQQAGILTIGIWNTTIGFAVWLAGLGAVPDAQRGNYMFFLKPVIAAFLAVLILGESISLFQALAIFAICFCVAMEVVWSEKRARRAVSA